MNLFNIIEEIEKVDPEIYDRLNPRRSAIKNLTNFGSKVAIASLPFALGTTLKKAYGRSAAAMPTDVLNFALTLEYIEAAFYNAGVMSSGLIPASYGSYIGTIQGDENAHVAFLKTTITSLGGTPVSQPNVDPTGSGAFPDVLSNFATFLAVANVFEDTGVRAYKGQAANLLGNQIVLTAALSIHAVEARHASAIRTMRAGYAASGVPNLTPWIIGANDTGVGTAVDANYGAGSPAAMFPAESNTIQGGVDVTTLASASGSTTSAAIATAAFDEPLDMATVVGIVTPFIKA